MNYDTYIVITAGMQVGLNLNVVHAMDSFQAARVGLLIADQAQRGLDITCTVQLREESVHGVEGLCEFGNIVQFDDEPRATCYVLHYSKVEPHALPDLFTRVVQSHLA